MQSIKGCLFIIYGVFMCTALASSDNLNRCLKSRNHKTRPGKEGAEFHSYHCSPWVPRSCCTSNTSRFIQEDGALSLYNMKWNHCKRNLSTSCRQWFQKDTCFYECSPNIGPWIVDDRRSKKTRRERIINVPLCASDCDDWFEACKDDLTCSDNWSKYWEWTKQGNMCIKECKTFKEYFKDSRNFCTNIFDRSFQYKTGTPGVDCFSLWPKLSKSGDNPNTNVAKAAQDMFDKEKQEKDPKVLDVLDKCLDGKYHKEKPGPEADGFKHECIPWQAHSCCTINTTKSVKEDGTSSLYSMKWNHCGNLSKSCRDYFIKDTCFYECSPNLAPWIVKDHVSKRTRKERFLNIPLCSDDCDGWFEACKEDHTCSDNWGENWKWTKTGNECKMGCKRFKDYFKDSVMFCNKIFNYSFAYTNGELGKDCMTLWPDSNVKDLNREVAYLAAKKLPTSHASVCRLNVQVFVTLFMTFVFLFNNMC